MSMKIKQITLRNVLGVKEFRLDVDGPTFIDGGNGAGKSSVLKGLQTLIGGGSMASIRNLDAPDDEPAEGVLVLDSDEYGTVRIEKNEKGLKVKKQVEDSQAFEDIKAPQRFLNKIFDASSINPVRFLTASPKDRVSLLLESLEFDHNADALWERMGLDRKNFVIPRGLHPLKEIGLIREAVFKERTGVNRDANNADAACDQIRRSIPAEVPTVEKTEHIEKEIRELTSEHGRKTEAARVTAKHAKAEVVKDMNRLEEKQRDELNRYEAELRAEVAEKLNAKKSNFRKQLRDARTSGEAAIESIEESLNDKLGKADELRDRAAQLSTELAKLKEQHEGAIRIRTLAEQADKHEEDSRTWKSLSKRLTAALDTLDSYKAELCSGLPIDGLEIDGDGIRIDGVPWEQVNTSRQIRVAVDLACLRMKDKTLRPVFVDGAEALDEDTLSLLLSTLEEAGAQPFFARVTRGPLSIGCGS